VDISLIATEQGMANAAKNRDSRQDRQAHQAAFAPNTEPDLLLSEDFATAVVSAPQLVNF
jgi:hypothetical protein